MSRQTVIVLVFVAAAALAGAFALGVFERDSARPATEETPPRAPVPPPQPRDTSAPSPRPDPARAAPARPPAPPRAAAPPPPPVAPTTATLRIDSDVPGAQVFLDNKFVGPAPATARDVAPGQRKINVQAPGYESVAEFVDVAPGPRELMISLKTIRLDQRVTVTHKHRIGSCSGTLIAAPDGLRYETANQDDGFTVSLKNLDVFEADFLQKNLRVKIRGGRTYDFTDPSGKADALYLFHQEVDKVRKRLVGGTE